MSAPGCRGRPAHQGQIIENADSGPSYRSVSIRESSVHTTASRPIGSTFPAVAPAGEVIPPSGLAGLSLAPGLGDGSVPAPRLEIPVVLKFCRSAATVRLRIAPVPAVRRATAGPAKGSVFEEIVLLFRRLLHADQHGTGAFVRCVKNVRRT